MILRINMKRSDRYEISVGAGTIAVFYPDNDLLFIQKDFYNRNRLAGVAEELRDYVSKEFSIPPEYIDVRLSDGFEENSI